MHIHTGKKSEAQLGGKCLFLFSPPPSIGTHLFPILTHSVKTDSPQNWKQLNSQHPVRQSYDQPADSGHHGTLFLSYYTTELTWLCTVIARRSTLTSQWRCTAEKTQCHPISYICISNPYDSLRMNRLRNP